MSSRDPHKAFRALVLAAVLVLPALPARALPLESAFRLSDGRSAFSVFLEDLRSVWRSFWGQEGMTIDPSGRPNGSGMSNVVGREGITIDPDGKPAGSNGGNVTNPGQGTNEGITIDPNG
jgi:hypothetical protein